MPVPLADFGSMLRSMAQPETPNPCEVMNTSGPGRSIDISDVASAYGSRYLNSGYTLVVNRTALGLTPGVYNIAVHAHSTAAGAFNNVALVRVTLQ